MENNENQKTILLRKILKSVHESLGNALRLLEEGESVDMDQMEKAIAELRSKSDVGDLDGGRVVEGVFDGQNMISEDGKQYHVPPNYASKSKLVEGDRLKLTISATGLFVYKQIGPVARENLVGQLIQDPATRMYSVVANDHKWNVLTASITYFRGETGDEVMIVVPKGEVSKWAAVDHVIKA